MSPDPGYLAVVNFERFQHYKDRNPPWIKLHASLFDDYEFTRLQDASKMHLMGIWVLASKTGNRVPADPIWIASRIGATTPVDLEVLIAAGFLIRLHPSSDVLAPCKQSAPLDRDRGRGEAEGETETESGSSSAPALNGRATLTEYAVRCTVAANKGLRENPAVGNRVNELVTSNEAEYTQVWCDRGVPLDLAASVIFDMAKRYEPRGRSRQPTTLKYFSGAVLEAHEQAELRAKEADFVPPSNGKPPGDSWVERANRERGYTPEFYEQLRKAREDEAHHEH